MEFKQVIVNNIRSFYDNRNVNYNVNQIEILVNKSIEAKINLISLIETLPNYDANEMRAYVNTEIKTASKTYDAEVVLSNFLYRQFLSNNISETLYRTFANLRFTMGSTENLSAYARNTFNIKINPTLKYSRALNKLLSMVLPESAFKSDDYNQSFARISDLISEKSENIRVYISANPYDYVSQSNGNSWSSCHYVDGCHRSGAIGYMLDTGSLVVYTSVNDDDITSTKKTRAMMYLLTDNDNNHLLLSEVYPFKTDDVKVNYTEIMANVFNGTMGSLNGYLNSYVDTNTDYIYLDIGNLYYSVPILLPNKVVEYTLEVGATSTCLLCGRNTANSETFYCYNCDDSHICCECGNSIYEDDSIYIDGECYCRECCSYCDECDEYHVGDNVQYVVSTDRWVCQDCLDSQYDYCSECGAYYLSGKVYSDDYGNIYCSDCYSNRYTTCEQCECELRIGDELTINDIRVCSDCYDDLNKAQIEEEEEEITDYHIHDYKNVHDNETDVIV